MLNPSGPLPLADGTVDAADRPHTAMAYRGIAAAEPSEQTQAVYVGFTRDVGRVGMF